MSPDIDFTVYAQHCIPFIDGHNRQGRSAHLIVDVPTSLVISENVRCRLNAIAGLRWLKIYDSVDTCGKILVYDLPRPETDQYLVFKYGDESMEGRLMSSRLLILHRESAEVFYEGSAGDEG
jgi:hypothetical protein